jgi:hypothetical protein
MTEPKGSRFDSRRSGFGAGRTPVSRLPLLEVAALQLRAIGLSSQHTHRLAIFLLHCMSPLLAQSGHP